MHSLRWRSVIVVMALLACVVMLGFYLALCWIFLLHNPETDAAVFPILRYCLTAALPLWLGCQALSCLCFFLFKSDIAATFACVGVVIVVPTALDLFSLLFEGPVSVQVSIQERYQPDMSHHYDPSGRTVAEAYPEIEFQVGDDVVRVLRVCTYRSIPWGHLMAFVNLDSYDQQFMGMVGRKEMILESQSGEQGEVLIAGLYDWWNAGDGCVAIGPEDTHVTLRYDIYGESGSIRIPLPEGETP